MRNKLENFPVSSFAVPLGLIGFTLAWQKAEAVLKLDFSVSVFLLYFSLVITFIIILVYTLKIVMYFKEAEKEFNHPVKLNFYPIIAKIFLIISIIYLSIDMDISRYFWWAGVIVQSFFTIVVMSSWIRHDKYEIKHINPSWFIPVVGCIMIPIAGVEHFAPELSWFFFSIGFFWWLILTVLIVNRIIFHHPIQDKLIPTLFILFAPPIIGFISLSKLVIGVNYFGDMLYYFGTFLFILILFQFKLFTRLKFYLSWWAYSFPLDALAIGTLLMYHRSNLSFFRGASFGILVLLNIVIFILIFKTILAVKNGQICVSENDEA